MTLTEVQREIETGRLTVDGLKWIVLHMAADSPDRFADATAALREHTAVYPECRDRYVNPAPVTDGVPCPTCGATGVGKDGPGTCGTCGGTGTW